MSLHLGLMVAVGLFNFVYSMILTRDLGTACQIAPLSSAVSLVSAVSLSMMSASLVMLICARKNKGCAVLEKKNQLLVLGIALSCVLLILSGAIMYEIEKVPSTCQVDKIPTIASIGGNLLGLLLWGAIWRISL